MVKPEIIHQSHPAMALAVDVQTEGLRQLERAERLVELGSSGPRNRRTAVTRLSHGGMVENGWRMDGKMWTNMELGWKNMENRWKNYGIWMEYGGFLNWWYPQIIHFRLGLSITKAIQLWGYPHL